MSKREKTYLVTGAAGFIGARFVESCAAGPEQGGPIQIWSVDQESHFGERTEHRGVPFGRIVDREKLFEVLAQEKPTFDAIIHLGACSSTMELNEEYLRRVNIEYSQKLWTFATERQIPMIYASSAATYGDGQLGYDDDEKTISSLRPLNPYGESKRIFDLWALEQESKGHCPPRWAGFKFFNVYGFGERHKLRMASVVLHAFDQIRASGQVKLFKSHREGIADGHQKRDFISVQDVVKVLHFACGTQASPSGETGLKRGIYNLGTGHARTFLDLVRAVFQSLGLPENIDFVDTPVALRDRYQYFTEAKMEKLRQNGYTAPFQSLEDGVRTYVERLNRNKT